MDLVEPHNEVMEVSEYPDALCRGAHDQGLFVALRFGLVNNGFHAIPDSNDLVPDDRHPLAGVFLHFNVEHVVGSEDVSFGRGLCSSGSLAVTVAIPGPAIEIVV